MNHGHPTIAIKLNLAKAYDQLSWDFLKFSLQIFTFANTFQQFIMRCVSIVSIAIAYNGCIFEFLQIHQRPKAGWSNIPLTLQFMHVDASLSHWPSYWSRSLEEYILPAYGFPCLTYVAGWWHRYFWGSNSSECSTYVACCGDLLPGIWTSFFFFLQNPKFLLLIISLLNWKIFCLMRDIWFGDHLSWNILAFHSF